MKMRQTSLVKNLVGVSVLLVLLGAGCTNSTTDTANTNTNNTNVAVPNTNTANTNETAVKIDPTAMPLDFPNSTLEAEVGDYVLAPSRVALNEAATEGAENTTFIYYMATVAEVGETASVLTEITEDVTIPNGVIIPIPQGQTAEVGDTVLTWWQSGSGLTRAYVVEGGTPTKPMVRYLDTEQLDDSEAEQLKTDSFVKITDAWQAGTSIAVRNGSDFDHYQVLKVSGEQILAYGFAGKLKVIDKADAIAMPIKLAVKVGDTVSVPFIGSYSEGTVTAVDDQNGNIDVEVEFGGDKEVDKYAYGTFIMSSDL
ncbi:MAG: hypothetical protein A2233_03045 [Candidatus Kerfeldbacteria bacterium RIFOXYA2_FULL_38_24]|uniref:Uncharacterized protein n=1 Tax=Candidatus Kerfeldbacteria bacterium RIFOXYB2_FULL_38_14 TaxID=1798547 RepID=A0A1G2BF45_9BACT|nr:MAG: hypothetical protein A2319_05015 [Candidatus Kerfeldbacteria bacterium RIFOXYB2_FULL_38_14]OGY88321.1 MAG: hypothetical protein A2233_03045 [Candidatus Kerfeldbacteria bacterium RIFOXYA2_FULL_38_24]